MVKEKNNTYISDYDYIQVVNEYSTLLKMDKSKYTILGYLSTMDKFFDFTQVKEEKDIRLITPQLCRKYQEHLKGEKCSHNTVNLHVRYLRTFYNWMVENEYLEKSPFEKVKNLKPNKITRTFMTDVEVEKFFTACETEEEKAMFGIYLSTGVRREELISMEISKIVDGYEIEIIGKGDKTRTIYLPPDVQYYLDQYLKIRLKKYPDLVELPWIFVSNWKKKYSGEAIRLKFKKILERAKFSPERIEELHVHSTRHTFTAKLLGRGENMKVAQMALGHSNMATTQNIYAHLENKHVEKAMRGQNLLSGFAD